MGGEVYEDDDFHSVIVDGKWRFGVQLAPNHVPPVDMQIEMDLLPLCPFGPRVGGLEQSGPKRDRVLFDTEEGHQVYADPAGHPFCLGWHKNVPAVHDFGATKG